ncbi:MAG: YeeE/YedE family protein [Alphaproteobacteria bacterium]|nr:YeeE/YedE family protein [Alphaproteobacteria bacterium]
MENFTPWSALIGGALIGLSAGFLMLANGRIAGISGILGQLMTPREGDNGWRIAFFAGLVVAPPLVTLLGLASGEVRIDVSLPLVVLGGLLVGFGTRLGSGCTSGHGVCGLARLSPRSLAATLVFMAVGAGVVFLVRHLIGG